MTLSCKAQAFSVANLLKPSAPREELGSKYHPGAHHQQIFDIFQTNANFRKEECGVDLLSTDRKRIRRHTNDYRLSTEVTCTDDDNPILKSTAYDGMHGKITCRIEESGDELKMSRDRLFRERNVCSRSGLELKEELSYEEWYGVRAVTKKQRVTEAIGGRIAGKHARPRCHGNGKEGHEPQRPAPGSLSARRQRPGPVEERSGHSSGSASAGNICFCHGEISYCHHPGVQTVTDSNDPEKAIWVELCHADLWSSFHRLGTEMIITKSGRRMFPSMKMRVTGLNPETMYTMRLEFLQPDTRKYRYMYHSSRWMVSGSGDAMSIPPCHVNPEGPISGQTICSQIVSFERLKMTNTESSKAGQVSLVSMQKFQPQVVIEEVCSARNAEGALLEQYVIMFPQTSFMAVTAYQNQQITTLKIASNPFAKGFRESGKTRVPYEAIMGSYPNIIAYNTGVGYLPGLPLLSGLYQGNASNSNKRCYRESFYEDAVDMEQKPQILKLGAHKSIGILTQPDTILPGYQSEPVFSQSYSHSPFETQGRDLPERHRQLTNHVVQVLNRRALPSSPTSAALTRSPAASENAVSSFSTRPSESITSNVKSDHALPTRASLLYPTIGTGLVSSSTSLAAESRWSNRRHFSKARTDATADSQDGRLPVFVNATQVLSRHQTKAKNEVTLEQIHFRSRSVSLGRSPSVVSSRPRCQTEPSRTAEEILNGNDVIKFGLETMAIPWANSFSSIQCLHLP